jgi:hypothetical protein
MPCFSRGTKTPFSCFTWNMHACFGMVMCFHFLGDANCLFVQGTWLRVCVCVWVYVCVCAGMCLRACLFAGVFFHGEYVFFKNVCDWNHVNCFGQRVSKEHLHNFSALKLQHN